MSKKKVAIIGSGRVGSNLAVSLWNTKKYEICAIIDKRPSAAKRIARRVHCPIFSTKPDALPNDASIIVIAIPDDMISDLVQRLLKVNVGILNNCMVVHTSGALSSELLNPLAIKGVGIAAIHPIQSFQEFEKAPTDLKNVYFGIEGSLNAIKAAENLVLDLGAIPVLITGAAKPFYHLACSIASNFLVTLLSMVFDILGTSGFDRKSIYQMLKPLLMTTLKNVETSSPEKALTGPVSRGDMETVAVHLQALKTKYPDYLESYVELAKITAQISLKEKRISEIQAEQLDELLRLYISTFDKCGRN